MIDFYGDCFGLGDEPRPEIPGVPGALAGRRRPASSTSSARRRAGTPIDSTGNHYCVAVDDLDAAIAELEAHGHRVQARRAGRVDVQIWITDPAGNTIELQQDDAS